MSNQRRFEGQVAVVTGGASGIGHATAARLGAEGARVILTDWSERRGLLAEHALKDMGWNVEFRHHDAGDPASWNDLERYIADEIGILHLLVNNAYSGRSVPFEEVTLDNLRDGLRVNAEGAVLGMKLAGKMMHHGGAVVNLASVAALGPAPDNMAYAMAKSALIHLTQSFALGFATREHLIRVNCVAPGLADTPAFRSTTRAAHGVEKNADISDLVAAAGASLPIGRLADPPEVASVIAFLLSKDAGYILGQCLVVDGGHMLRPA